MYLDREQERALAGDRGPSLQWAMRTLCRLGDRHGATRLVAVSSVHIPDWFAHRGSELWDRLAGLEGAPAPTTANPGGPPADRLSRARARQLERLRPTSVYTCTCAPYLAGNHPSPGAAVAWGGRAAGAFANSVLGARSAEESFESALASAIAGLTPERGLLRPEARTPTVAVAVTEWPREDHALLGWLLSRMMPDEVPQLSGVRPSFDEAKRMVFSANWEGRVPLLRLNGTAPPADLDRIELGLPEWREAVEGTGLNEPDLIVMGCPHLSEQDINRWGRYLADRPPSGTEAWFFTSRICMDKCPLSGAVLASRGKVLPDMCPLTLLDELLGRRVGCDSPGLAACLRGAGVEAGYLAAQDLKAMLAPR